MDGIKTTPIYRSPRSKTNQLYSSYRGMPARWNMYFIIKRGIDLAVCILLLPFVLPAMMLISIIIMLDSPGNPIFVQERIGRRGRLFKIFKFRTMAANRDDQNDRAFMQTYIAGAVDNKASTGSEQVFKPNNQKDYTRVGRILRYTSLDEIPQLYNVLKGEMSLIGPRPNVLWEVEKYKLWHQSRLDVLPGITGLAQVKGRSSLTFNEIVRNDIYYVMNYSFLLDLKILWETFAVVFKGFGVR
jgi:lipopolysaccharide/colanic/teichoic acid biosynthesis glycosyltransferase